jgi:hypothetical protein
MAGIIKMPRLDQYRRTFKRHWPNLRRLFNLGRHDNANLHHIYMTSSQEEIDHIITIFVL